LSKQRDVISNELDARRAEIGNLKAQLAQAQQRCAAFERAGVPGANVDHVAENSDLRRRLSACMAELETLRHENDGLRAHRETSQQVMMQLHSDREQLHQAHIKLQEEHKQSSAERGRFQDLHSQEQEHRQRLELQLHSQAEERETALSARQEMLQREHQKVWEDLQQYRQKHNDKERNLRAFVRLAQDAFSMVTELQENFVEQTHRYQELSQHVRAQQQEMQKDILEAEQVAALSLQCAGELKSVLGHARDMSSAGEEQWKQDAHRLEEQLHNLHANHREAARTVREFRQADDARKQEEDRRREEQAKQAEERKKMMMERHGLVTSPNIIRQMAQAMVGIEVDKIDQKNRREKRKLKVICDVKTVRGIATNQVKLQWSKAPYREWSEKCSCDLSQVMSLGYAFAARATWLFPDQVSPHHCFSLQTPARSFDFICFSDNDVEALVLVISRLCTRIRGWPLHGGVSSHAKFTAMKGWSKVQAACRANRNQALSTYLREAAEKMPARQGPNQLPRVPSPDETDEEEEEEEEEMDEDEDSK